MASPLAWFRRNQKGMLIVFGVLLMAVFGLPSVFFNMTPQGGADPEMAETVVKYNGGSFTRGEFREYRYRNAQAVRFVNELQRAAVDRKGIENYRQGAPMISAIDRGDASPQELDREVMRRIILRQKAEEIGMTVGNDAVVDYLRQIADDDQLTQRDLVQFSFDVFKGSTDYITVREQLKKEIIIQQMFGVLRSGEMIGIVTSGLPDAPSITEAWEDWLKLNKRRAATVLQFPVSRYTDQVTGEPNLSELRSIFADGEYDFADPANEKPGFKLRRRVKMVVLTASFEDFLTNAVNAITNEQVQELYDEMVENKDPLVMEIVPETTPDGEGEDNENAPPTLDLSGEDEPTTAGDGESSGQEGTEGESTESGEGTTGESESGEGENSGSEGTEEGDGDGLPESGPSARVQEEQEENKQESGESQNTTEDENKQESGEESSEGADTNTEASEQDSDGEQDSGTTAEQDLIGDLDTGPERRVKPLDEELANTLKRQLARVPATNAMTNAIQEASGDIGDYSSDLTAFESTKDDPIDEREPEPDPLNLDSLAREYKLTKQETGLMDYAEMRDSLIGQTNVSIQQMMFGRPITRPFSLADYVFSNYYQMSEWVPETLTEYNSPNQHIVFFVEKADPKVRSFDEAREDVIEYWRYQQAIQLAKDAAQKVADEMNSKSETLAEVYPADANDVGEFSYHTSTRLYPELVGLPKEGALPATVRTGPEFMETAFGTDVDQCGVAADLLRENIYVIQVNGVDQRPTEELQQAFFNEISVNRGISRGIQSLYSVDQQEFMDRYFEEIDKELDIKWLAH